MSPFHLLFLPPAISKKFVFVSSIHTFEGEWVTYSAITICTTYFCQISFDCKKTVIAVCERNYSKVYANF